MTQFIHFADNNKRVPAGQPGFDQLFKVSWALDTMMKGCRAAWNPGQKVTIDESMIKYCGRAVTFVQYMPAKPIKHGIKVFVLCCAMSAVWLSYKIYVGAQDGVDGSALAICDELVNDAGLTDCRGRVLYTDNWYTSVRLAQHMFEKYGWTTCGTIVPTDKKSRQDLDIPFLKLSNGAKNSVERGWFREAAIELKSPRGKRYCIQCTTWRDKKQVCFLSTNTIGASEGLFVKRGQKGKRQRDMIPGPMAQLDYAAHFNAVDRNDRDSSDYSTTIRTLRYYLRIFCWGLDRVVHTCYVIVCYLATAGVGNREWKKYKMRKNGRHDFQIDLGLALISFAIKLEWTGVKRPGWMRQGQFVPCDCKQCYFCVNGHTTGIAHVKSKEEISVEYRCGKRAKTTECTEDRVDLGIGSGAYCKMCYRTVKNDERFKHLTTKQKQKKCNTSRQGCGQCKEAICDRCWNKGYDRHQTGQ